MEFQPRACSFLLVARGPGQKDAMGRIGGSFDTPASTPWAQKTLTRRLSLVATATPPLPPGVPLVCVTECPVRPRTLRSAVELLANHPPCVVHPWCSPSVTRPTPASLTNSGARYTLCTLSIGCTRYTLCTWSIGCTRCTLYTWSIGCTRYTLCTWSIECTRYTLCSR